MKRPGLMAILLGTGLACGLVYLFDLQFASGEVYPEFSSLRADPLGSKLLYDTLARIPGIHVSRNFAALDEAGDGTTVLMLGWRPAAMAEDSEMLRRMAERGTRLVVAFTADPHARTDALEASWGLLLATDGQARHSHPLYFRDARGWNVLERAGGKILALEKSFKRGSVAVWSESDDFANESTAAGDRFDELVKALGPNTRVVFDERHFGIAESGSVIALARRFRLGGMALGLGLCAAILIWRNASPFPPPDQVVGGQSLAGRTSHAGLVNLLRRNIPLDALAGTCWEEWLAGNPREKSAAKVERAATLVGQAGNRPLDTLREVQSVLQGKGEC